VFVVCDGIQTRGNGIRERLRIADLQIRCSIRYQHRAQWRDTVVERVMPECSGSGIEYGGSIGSRERGGRG
jgi:hypothetical protein